MESIMKGTIESITGISIGIFDRCHWDQVPEEPTIAAHFFQDSWEKFCNDFRISSEGVIFSDAKPQEFGFARIHFRDHNRIDRETGISNAQFTEILIQGRLEFSVRFPMEDRNTEFFIYHMDNGTIVLAH